MSNRRGTFSPEARGLAVRGCAHLAACLASEEAADTPAQSFALAGGLSLNLGQGV